MRLFSTWCEGPSCAPTISTHSSSTQPPVTSSLSEHPLLEVVATWTASTGNSKVSLFPHLQPPCHLFTIPMHPTPSLRHFRQTTHTLSDFMGDLRRKWNTDVFSYSQRTHFKDPSRLLNGQIDWFCLHVHPHWMLFLSGPGTTLHTVAKPLAA